MANLVKTYSKPLVSIILVSHDGDAHLMGRAVDSICRQDIGTESLELIIAFDGVPSSQSEAYMQDACSGVRFPVRVFWADEKTDYYTIPRNRVTPMAQGLYIYNMDVDNEIAPSHLSGLLEALRVPHPEEGWPHFAYSRRQYISDDSYKRSGKPLLEGTSPLVEWTEETVRSLCSAPTANFVDTGDMLMGKSVFYELAERTGFIWNPELKRFGDWDLVKRMAQSGFRGKAVDQVTNLYHVTGGNVSLTRHLSDMVVIQQEMYDELKLRGQVIE